MIQKKKEHRTNELMKPNENRKQTPPAQRLYLTGATHTHTQTL